MAEPVERICARVLARVEKSFLSLRMVIEDMKPRAPRGLLNALCLGTLRNYKLLEQALRACGYSGKLRGGARGWLPLVLAYEAMFRPVELERVAMLGLPENVASCLRKLSPEDVAVGLSGTERLSVLYSVPEWVVEELMKVEPPGGVEKLLKAFQEPTPVWLRYNVSKLTVEEALERLKSIGVDARPDPVLEDSLEVVKSVPGWVSKLDTRLFYVQDRSAILAAHLLPQSKVLVDLFSAPGNKLAHAWWRRRFAYSVAVEVSPRRLGDELKLLRAQGAEHFVTLVAGDARLPPLRADSVDAVLVDPDCSSIGRIGHSPETRLFLEETGRSIVYRLSRLQLRGLLRALELVKPGGVVVYTTCTLTRRENEDVVAKAASEAGAELVEAKPLIGVWSPWLRGAQRVYPHVSRCMGGFAAILLKPG